MQLISGKPIAEQILASARALISQHQLIPGLAVVLVGHDPASEIYVGLKEKAAQSVGVRFEKYNLPVTTETAAVCKLLQTLNARPDVHGIIVQLPLPPTIDADTVIATIRPEKDADGFHPDTVKYFLSGAVDVPPVFPRAILALLESTGVPLAHKRAFIFANSKLFAQVMTTALARLVIHAEDSVTGQAKEMLSLVQQADIIISAKGDPHFLVGSMVRPGAIIIDGGITRVGETVKSDADTESFKGIPGYITPVPGGVGPVTVALLMLRVTELARGPSSRSGVY